MQSPRYPLTIFYAFKQAESEESNDEDDSSRILVSTGWETMLEGLIRAGFQISGTLADAQRALKPNDRFGYECTRFLSRPSLQAEARRRATCYTPRIHSRAARRLPIALKTLQHGNIAPVDLAQAAIGPGMAVFSRYSSP